VPSHRQGYQCHLQALLQRHKAENTVATGIGIAIGTGTVGFRGSATVTGIGALTEDGETAAEVGREAAAEDEIGAKDGIATGIGGLGAETAIETIGATGTERQEIAIPRQGSVVR
jgi:hypothetical protein